jgi:type IV pilus assembly protein PilY1
VGVFKVNQTKSNQSAIPINILSGLLISLMAVSEMAYGVGTAISQKPLFVGQSAAPKVLLNMSKDHQLFFKAYDDYSDLDNDGIPETTYKHSFDYYGYFDNTKCYNYSATNGRFEPSGITSNKYCSGNSIDDRSGWSGNFLNWATMSRMDIVRKILYGGLRSTDTAASTVLERAYIPTDAHSWAKFYKGEDIEKLTPFDFKEEGITLCNTTEATGVVSQNVNTSTFPPLIRAAKGDYSLWAANESWQCRWKEDVNVSNGNTFALSGMNAQSATPNEGDSDSEEYIARVQVCVGDDLEGGETCKNYTSNLKPTGLLQEFGDDGRMWFGLMSGSYQKNKQGGVLRKNIDSFTDEVNPDGTFIPVTSDGIVDTLNKLRMVGYDTSTGLYNNTDNCPWLQSDFTDGNCRSWGNPQSELFLESLRYLAGKNATTNYSADDTNAIAGLTKATFTDPITSAQSCASLNVIQFNASTTSFDADELSLASDVIASPATLNGATDAVGAGEISATSQFFIGENGTDNNQLCTAKSVSPSGSSNTLSKLRGTCPDAPRLSGSYQIAGLAHYAHTNDIRPGSSLANTQLVNLFGVALAPALPKVVVPVPGSTTKKITILPACRNTSMTPNANCAIVDYKIINQSTATSSSGTSTGRLYVNWEDNEQGGDYDKDQWGIISYSITSSQVTITTDVLNQAAGAVLGFGYIINGTSQDGFHVHSGINGFAFTDSTGLTCTNCRDTDGATSRTYAVGTSDAKSLEQPLYYAAKWGGFKDSNGNKIPDLQSEWDAVNNSNGNAGADGIPDKYFPVTNPSVLENSLGAALDSIGNDAAAASSVATNSTQLDAGSVVYQAKFSPIDWSGDVIAFSVDTSTGALTENWKVSDSGKIPLPVNRNVWTYNPSATLGTRGMAFLWANLTCSGTGTSCPVARRVAPSGTAQQDYLNKSPSATTDNKGSLRVGWLRGDKTNEKFNRLDTNTAHIFRKRNVLLGDTINSDPLFVGTEDFGYGTLSGTEGSTYTTFRTGTAYLARTPVLYVGANDGMLHGFDARKISGTVTTGGSEILAYIPNAVYPQLSKLTSPSYSHQYYNDGSPVSGDVYDSTATNSWRTLLVGTTGAGGRAVFGLDVTNPTAFSSANVMWEFTDTATSTATVDCSAFNFTGFTSTNYDSNDLGYTLAQPTIARLENGKWVVIVANGYNSNNGHAVLFVLDAKTGCIIKKFDTGSGTTTNKNGLSSPIAVDANNNRSVDAVYAGDLLGNVWKFDLSNTGTASVAAWNIPGSSPFFVACTIAGAGTSCVDANRQPITSKPSVGKVRPVGSDQNGVGVMVYVGTGKFFETGDNTLPVSPALPQVQAFYGLWDDGSKITNRNLLQEQTIDFEGFATTVAGTQTTKPIRVVSKNPVCYASTTSGCTTSSPLKRGWALKLVVGPGNVARGERSVSLPLIRRDLLVFSTVIPNPDPCGDGGASRLMEIDALTGGEPSIIPFDVTGNRRITTDDYVLIDGVRHAAAGVDQGIGVSKQPAVIESPNESVDFKYTSGSTTEIAVLTDWAPTSDASRRSWKQLNTW